MNFIFSIQSRWMERMNELCEQLKGTSIQFNGKWENIDTIPIKQLITNIEWRDLDVKDESTTHQEFAPKKGSKMVCWVNV